MEILILSIIAIILICLAYYFGYKKDKHIKELNNQKLLDEAKLLKEQNQQLNSIYQSNLYQLDQIEQSIKANFRELDKQYYEQTKEYDSKLQEYAKSIELKKQDLKNELVSLRNTKAATIEALQREQAIQKEKDLYRIDLSEQDQADIAFLRSIQYRISKPRLLSMLIWQNYVQPIAKVKLPLILGSDKVCGIYKITNCKTQMAYVGQAIDVKKRLNEHLKKGLGIDTPQNNKLYKAMREDGIENFTFELLEECQKEKLNEKEKFYIELYNCVEYGYNGQVGNSG